MLFRWELAIFLSIIFFSFRFEIILSYPSSSSISWIFLFCVISFPNSRIICFLTSSDTLICFTCWIIFKTMNTIIRQNLHFIFLRLFLNFISYSYPISDRFLIFFSLRHFDKTIESNWKIFLIKNKNKNK